MGVWDEQLIGDFFYLWIVLTEADWGWRVIISSQPRPEMTPKSWGFCQHQMGNLFLSLWSREIHKNIWEFKPLASREINVYLLKSFQVNTKRINKLNTLNKQNNLNEINCKNILFAQHKRERAQDIMKKNWWYQKWTVADITFNQK